MSVFNRRNAILGWTVWQATKRIAKHKAKEAAPKMDKDEETGARRPNKPAIAAALLGVAAAVAFWRKKSSGDDTPE